MIDYNVDNDWKGIFWIIGGIDSNGYIEAHEGHLNNYDTQMHTDRQLAMTTWRFNICQQEFVAHFVMGRRHMTEEELTKVENWLQRKGYLDEEQYRIY